MFPENRVYSLAVRLIVLLALLAVPAPASSPIVREEGAIYLSDFDIPQVRLAMLQEAPCYFEMDARRFAGMLRYPQSVKLDAVGPAGMLRVRGNAQQGGVAAWVDQASLQPLPEGFVEALHRAEERRKRVDELVARNEVALGMTLDEVTRSLGKPQKRSSRSSREGTSRVFEYIKYKLVPQTVFTPAYAQSIAGYRPVPGRRLDTVVMRSNYGYGASTIYIKVPVGTVTVSFVNGIVESVEQSEGTTAGANAGIVVPPINIGW